MKKEQVAMANDMTAFYPALGDPGRASSGMVFAANDANFDSAHLSEPLTEYIVGVQETADLGATLEAIAPSVPVGRSFSYRKHDEREAFQSDGVSNDDIREIGGEFALIRRTGEQLDGRTDNKGLTMVIDNDQGGEDPAVQQRAVVNLTDRLLRSEIVRVEALLEANDVQDAKNWGATNTAADPDYDVVNNVDLSGDARGIDANIVLFGGGAYVKRIAALRRSASSGGFATGGLSPTQLAEFYGVESVVKAGMRFQSTASAKAKVVADKVYCYYAGRNLMADDPSNIKRFVTPTPDGALRVYVQPALKRTLISVEHYSRIILTSSLGIRKIAVTFT
jgi:hypothetical protein